MNKQIKLLLATIAAAVLIGSAIVAVLFNVTGTRAEPATVTRVAAFTLQGCGGCNEALNELKRFEIAHPEFTYDYFNITKDVKTVNRYAVTEHPTVLFLNIDGHELGRLEKHITSEGVEKKLGQLQATPTSPIVHGQTTVLAGSVPVSIYLADKQRLNYVKVTQYVKKETNVRYPKIAALELLFSIRDGLPSNLYNPIPEDVEFVQIVDRGGVTAVELSERFGVIADTEEGRRIVESVALTLGAFENVDRIQIFTQHYEGEPFSALDFADKAADALTYTVETGDKESPNIGLEQYNAAVLHRDDLKYIPCFCGCESAGHTSNLNCYFSTPQNSSLRFSSHAENCRMCLDITDSFLAGKQAGLTLAKIRTVIEDSYGNGQGTDTPPVPVR